VSDSRGWHPVIEEFAQITRAAGKAVSMWKVDMKQEFGVL